MPILKHSIAIIILQSCFVWMSVWGNCDTTVCPILCTGPCPGIGSSTLTIFPISGCQEVIVESPGYPNGYVGIPCEWNFIMASDLWTSTVLRFYDHYLKTGDDLTITGVRPLAGGGTKPVNFVTGCCANPNNQITRAISSLQVAFTPQQTSYEGGFSARFTFSDRAATDACSTTKTISLDAFSTVAAFNSPNFPADYHPPLECYYTLTSPDDTIIVLEFIGNLGLNLFEDFVFIYDSLDPMNPKLLRIVSDKQFRTFREIYTETKNVQVAFKSTSADRAPGFFVRVSYEEAYQKCRGNGALIDQCDCSTYTAGQVCMFDDMTDYEPITLPTMAGTSTCGVEFELSFDSNNANVILYPNSYFTGVLDGGPCFWFFYGPEYSYHAIIFRDFLLEPSLDQFSIIYTDRRAFGFMMYSSNLVELAYTRSGTPSNFSLIGTPIIIDSYSFKIIYEGNTATPGTYRGPLFEVHLLGIGLCSTPCLNGGQCSGYCDCNDGFQGRLCEQTTPADFTCVVKNPYIPPHFAYPVQLHASPGRPSITPYEISFDVYRYNEGYNEFSLPMNSKKTVEPHTVALSLPSSCDAKDGSSRFGVFVCSVSGHDFIESVDVPAIVNPKSEFISPVGRFTKTVSVGDAQVSFTVDHLASVQYALRWKFNGQVQQKWNGKSTITITNIETTDCGIYECFIREGKHKDYDVVRYRLIVRECPDGMYGSPSCTGTCPSCQNGGTCSDVYGTCVCPPSYSGALCDEVFTRSTISRLNDHITCPHLELASDGCKYIMFCLPDPGGCMCMPGWTGSACDIPCPALKYGLECLFDCSCGTGIQCDAATGACP